MNSEEAQKIALRLKSCATQMEGCVSSDFTAEDANIKAAEALGALMFARETATSELPLLMQPAVDRIYEEAAFHLRVKVSALDTDDRLNDIYRILMAATGVYRPEAPDPSSFCGRAVPPEPDASDFNTSRRCAFDLDSEFTQCVTGKCQECEHFPNDIEARRRAYDRKIDWCMFEGYTRCFHANEENFPCKDCEISKHSGENEDENPR